MTKRALLRLWSNEVEQDLKLLNELSLLETNDKRVSLSPFMVQYVNESMTSSDAEAFM